MLLGCVRVQDDFVNSRLIPRLCLQPAIFSNCTCNDRIPYLGCGTNTWIFYIQDFMWANLEI